MATCFVQWRIDQWHEPRAGRLASLDALAHQCQREARRVAPGAREQLAQDGAIERLAEGAVVLQRARREGMHAGAARLLHQLQQRLGMAVPAFGPGLAALRAVLGRGCLAAPVEAAGQRGPFGVVAVQQLHHDQPAAVGSAVPDARLAVPARIFMARRDGRVRIVGGEQHAHREPQPVALVGRAAQREPAQGAPGAAAQVVVRALAQREPAVGAHDLLRDVDIAAVEHRPLAGAAKARALRFETLVQQAQQAVVARELGALVEPAPGAEAARGQRQLLRHVVQRTARQAGGLVLVEAFEQCEFEQLLRPVGVREALPVRGIGEPFAQQRGGLGHRHDLCLGPGAAQRAGPVVDDALGLRGATFGGPQRERGPARDARHLGVGRAARELDHRLEGARVAAAADGPGDAVVEHRVAGLDQLDQARHRLRETAFAKAPHGAAAAQRRQQAPGIGRDALEQDGVGR